MQCPTSRPCITLWLTSLPVSLLERILEHLCDNHLHALRSSFRGSTSFAWLPCNHPRTDFTLDHAEAAHAALPENLLAPALASPILAAAAVNLLGERLSYLTFLNTEGRLPLWIHAFARYVKAVSAGVVAEKWHSDLPHNLRALRLNKVCESTVDMFKEITVNYVRLQVLDLVRVPFDECGTTQDDLITGLCATLESSHTTLTTLALPVYAKSDLCACALEIVTLPHLDELSVELVNVHNPNNVSDRRKQRLGCPFLRMMQAVDGHADRSRGLTTLVVLRLINMYKVPCTAIKEAGCSAGLFRSVRTLRVAVNESVAIYEYNGLYDAREPEFFSLFRNLEVLYWNGVPCGVNSFFAFGELCEKLHEVHLCYRHWVTGAQIGTPKVRLFFDGHPGNLHDTIEICSEKIKTLVCYQTLYPSDLRAIARYCPYIRHLSLHVTPRSFLDLRRLIKACDQLRGVDIFVGERYMESLDRHRCLELAKAIPRRHASLRDVAIRTLGWSRITVSQADIIDCFVNVVKRLGCRSRRLEFHARTNSRGFMNLINDVSLILDTCADYAFCLKYLDICILPYGVLRWTRLPDLGEILFHGGKKLRTSRASLISSCSCLEKLELQGLHNLSI